MIGQFCLCDPGNCNRTVTEIIKKKTSRACTVLSFSLQVIARVTDDLNVLHLVYVFSNRRE